MNVFDDMYASTSYDSHHLLWLIMEVEKSEHAVALQDGNIAEDLAQICGGVNVSNMSLKAEALKQYLMSHDETCRRWLAQYFVLHLVPVDHTKHYLYHSFFKILGDRDLNKFIKKETFQNINILLNTRNKGDASSSLNNRALLRNYGHWLGLITVASNIPILYDELDLASVLLGAYSTGHQDLLYVAPFIAEVIIAGTKSHVFKPTCSWLQPIYRLFTEILRRLHMNLQTLAQSRSHDQHCLYRLNKQISEVDAIAEVIDAQYMEHRKDVTSSYTLYPRPFHYGSFNNTAAASGSEDDTQQQSLPDTEMTKEKLEAVFNEWLTICYRMRQPKIEEYLDLLQKYEISMEEEPICKMIKGCLKICTDAAYSALSQTGSEEVMGNSRSFCYYTIDAFIKLVILPIQNVQFFDGTNTLRLLQKSMEIVAQVLATDHDARMQDFNGMPFLRIFLQMVDTFAESNENVETETLTKIMEIFKDILLSIQPGKVPAFAFHWLEIIGHRKLIRIYLASNSNPSACAMYRQFLIRMVEFAAPSLQMEPMMSNLSPAIKKFYEGILRLFILILHDFPEFFCESAHVFCDIIPSNCFQLRNIVLCAFPSAMRPPDPFSLPFDTLANDPNMKVIPKVSSEMFKDIPASTRQVVTSYISKNGPISTDLFELASAFKVQNTHGESVYYVALLNSFSTFVGYQALFDLRDASEDISFPAVAHHSSMNIFKSLIAKFDPEGRYFLINSMVNQLRYPSAVTNYFACAVLSLFKYLNEDVKEQITHVLFKRSIALRPHPWGLTVTFLELLRNENYDFWNCEFIRRNPDIRSLLLGIAKRWNVFPSQYSER